MSDYGGALQEQLDVFGPDYDPEHKNHVYWAAKKYQDILDTNIDEWIEAEATIAKANRELSWRRVPQSQARDLLTALGITPEDTDDVIGVDGEPKWMPGDPDDGPILR